MKTCRLSHVVLALYLSFGTANCSAATHFSDGFDSLAAWNVLQQNDGTASIVDYGVLGIPEAPNMVVGSNATTGVMFTANTVAGQPTAVNLLGAVTGGNADLLLPGYTVEFDMYLSVAEPLPSGSTEQGLWGVGRSNTNVVGRNTSLSMGDGTFGWLATENGYLAEDAVAFVGNTEFARLSGASDPGLFNAAFAPTISTDAANSPANQWVDVRLAVSSGEVDVFFNGVQFFSIPAAATSGDVMVGYEDPFASISSSPSEQFGIIDNVVISEPLPGFSGYYDPSNWTTTTNGHGGFVETSAAPDSIAIFGPDDGSGLPGFIDYTIETPASGVLSFDWTFINLDEEPGLDTGFYINDNFVFLADDDASGTVSVPVSEGAVIGWGVESFDSILGPGILIISNFSAPIPEPASGILSVVCFAMMSLAARRHTSCRH